MRTTRPRRTRAIRAGDAPGFSLIELTLVLVILGVIGVLLVRWIGLVQEEDTRALQRTLLQRADDALTAFALAHSRLPCPASGSSGLEDCTAGAVGRLPYVTLGLPDVRAGQLRYGVLRRANATETLDADLADLKDRAHTLQILTNEPSVEIFALVQAPANCPKLSGQPFDCDNTPQISMNGVDLCVAVRTAMQLPQSTEFVHTRREHQPTEMAGNVAYALAMPDALSPAPEHTGSSVAFASPRRPGSPDYSDKVLAVGLDQIWARLRCGDTVGAATYAHPNVALAAGVTMPAMYDYQEQLEIMVDLAVANDLSADASIISAVAQISSATAGVLDTIGETLDTYGAWNWRVAVATVGIGTAVGGTVAAGIMKGYSTTYLTNSRQILADFTAGFPGPARALDNQIELEAGRADVLGLFPDPQVRSAALQLGAPTTP